MSTLGIDIETYSSVDLVKAGVYRYTSAPDFQVLLFAYAFNDEPVQIVDLASGGTLPSEIVHALADENMIKTAFNAQFERTCLSRHLGKQLSPIGWQCTAVQAAMLALPHSLDGVAEVYGLTEQKSKDGKELIRYFSIPCKATKTNGGRTHNLPQHAPDKWERFKAYCKQEVEVERAIRNKLSKFPLPVSEQHLYTLDQQINDRGVLADMALVTQAIRCDLLHQLDNLSKAKLLTGLENPNSVAQLKQWLSDNGTPVDSLSKKAVASLADESDGDVEELLNLRLQLAKTSVKKYEAIQRSVCPDGRVRGLLQFYGANRTGRWAGRLVQVQNLPQNHLPDLDLARGLLLAGNVEALEILFGNVPVVLSELIRTAFVPKAGHRFMVADFSAIEARVIAWLAGEKWRLDVFNTHGKIYEASASQMFRVPIEEITKTSPLRQKGKISELALVYGGGVGALKAMGALDMGLQESGLQPLVDAWRTANPKIVSLWWAIDNAAVKAVREKMPQAVGRIRFEYTSGILFITLPSGRKLSYIKPRLDVNKFGRDGLTYEGVGATKKWERIETYGPKLVENIVQAASRDLLAGGMLNVNSAGYDIVMHVHDEIVAEVQIGQRTIAEMCTLMAKAPDWATGLPLRADGYECNFYRKD